MRLALRGALALCTVGGALCLSNSTARAQGPGSSSLGGYGAASSYATAGTGGGGSGAMIIPYGGMFEGFMPSRTGGGNSLAGRSRPTAAMGSARTSFSLSPLSGGLGQNRTGIRITPFLGAPGGMVKRSSGIGGVGVMPPSFGYPFRQPPSLVPSSTPGAGVSM